MAKSAVQSRKKKARKASKEEYASRFYSYVKPGTKILTKKEKAASKKNGPMTGENS
jgi:hypothetical protein